MNDKKYKELLKEFEGKVVFIGQGNSSIKAITEILENVEECEVIEVPDERLPNGGDTVVADFDELEKIRKAPVPLTFETQTVNPFNMDVFDRVRYYGMSDSKKKGKGRNKKKKNPWD